MIAVICEVGPWVEVLVGMNATSALVGVDVRTMRISHQH